MKRLTHWNYKNTTLDLESCKPYLKLGEIEDLEDKFNVDVNEELFKKAKAFDVIKEKYVDMFELKCCSSAKEYNNCISFKIGFIKNYELTEEEYDLLKEVLER